MAGQVIDELVTIIRYNTSNRELRRAEQQVNDFTKNTQKRFQSWGQNISKITRAATVVIGALGAGAFKVGAAEERSFLNLQTQLGDTAEKVNELKDVAKGVSKETNRPLKELGDALFAIRSGGQKGAAGLDILNQSAKAAAAGLGETRPIGLLAASAINSYGEAALSGSDAVDKILAIVESGNLDASTLAEPMTQLLSPGAAVGVAFDELGASVAGYTRITGNASRAITGVYQALNALLKPTKEAETSINGVYGSIQNMHKAIREDGFFNVLQRLHGAVDGDVVAMGRMFSSTEALGFVLDATSLNAAAYAESLENINNSVGKVNKGFDIYANSSVAQADEATNNLRLALSSLYNNVLTPLLQLFGKLPSAIQTVVLGMGAMQIASTIGLGPSVGGLVTSLGRFIVALKTGTIWNSNFILSLRLAAINVHGFVASQILATLWNSNFVVSLRLAAINVRGFVASLSLARVAQLAGAAATGIASAATWAFNAALLANPLTWIVLAIVGLIAALVLLVKHWDTVKRVVRDFFDRYGNYALAALAVAMPFIGIPLLIARNWSRIVGVVRGVWDSVVGIFRDHWAKILAVIFPPVGIPLLIAQEWDQIVGIVGGIWNRVYETVKGWIEAIISFIKEIPGKVKDAVKDIPNMVTEAVKEIPVVGTVLNAASGVADKAKGFLGGIGKAVFAEGGIVPGPLGRPMLATVHGGEMVLPADTVGTLRQMLEGFRLGPAALPQAPPYYGQMYRSSVTNRTVNINMNEPIVIQTQATDAKGIAQEVGEAIQDQIRNVAYDHDGPVER